VDGARRDEGGEEVSIFSPTERTYRELAEVIKKIGLEKREPKILSEAMRFSGNSELGHIEKNLFTFGSAERIKGAGGVRIVSAVNFRAEVEYAARQIRKLVRKEGYRYRDIAVISPELEVYEHYIRGYFEDMGVPYFIDKKKSLNQYPVVEMISSALEIILKGFCHGDIFSYLKTGFAGVENEEIDVLENYCVAFGIRVRDWESEGVWSFDDEKKSKFDEEKVNSIRGKVRGPLVKLREELFEEERIEAGEFFRILYGFLEERGVFEAIEGLVKEAEERGDANRVNEHRQFCERLVELFDELGEVLGGEEMGVEELAEILRGAFSQMSLAFIPATLDQVLVGSIERSRHPDLKAVFLVGCTQKQFPVPVGNKGLLSDEERGFAEEGEIRLGVTERESLMEREYLVYIAFTRASEFLCVSYPASDSRGRELVRSQFIAELEDLFLDVEEEKVSGGDIDIEDIGSENELSEYLCRKLGKEGEAAEDKELREFAEGLCGDDELSEVGERVKGAIEYNNSARLDEEIVKESFGERIYSSATRLGIFAGCGYRHFAKYILGLEERAEFKLRPLDVGNFYHEVLDRLIKRMRGEKKGFDGVTDEQLIEILGEVTGEYVSSDSFIRNFSNHSRHSSFMIQAACERLEDFVLRMREMVLAGDFRPISSETWFGKEEEGLDGVKFGLRGGRELILRGKIDRIDVGEVDGDKVCVVFDYKRKDRSFSWSKFYHGLDMQLVLYLLAVSKSEKFGEVMGAFYIPVESKIESGTLEELKSGDIKNGIKGKGVFNGRIFEGLERGVSKDSRFYSFYVGKEGGPYGNYYKRGVLSEGDFEKVLEFAKEKIVELGEGMVSGDIRVRPYKLGKKSPCSYCEYKPVCRFDWLINEYNYLEGYGKKKVLEELGGGDG